MNAHCERFNHTIQDEFVDYHETLLFDDLDAAVPGVTVDTSDFLAKVTIAVSDVPAWRGTDSKRLKTPLPAYAGGGFSSPKEKVLLPTEGKKAHACLSSFELGRLNE